MAINQTFGLIFLPLALLTASCKKENKCDPNTASASDADQAAASDPCSPSTATEGGRQ